MKDKILEFIKRRFPEDCHWTDGNCYWFAYILCSRFEFLNIYYDSINGHFIAWDGVSSYYYDYFGKHEKNMEVVKFDDLLYLDTSLYLRLLRDCKN